MVGTEIRTLQRGLERIARLPKLGLTICAGTTCGATNTHMAASDDLAVSLKAAPIEHTRKVADHKAARKRRST